MLPGVSQRWQSLQVQPRSIQRLVQWLITLIVAMTVGYVLIQPLRLQQQQLAQENRQLSAQISVQSWQLAFYLMLTSDELTEQQQQAYRALFPIPGPSVSLAAHLVEPLVLSGSQLHGLSKLPLLNQDNWLQQPWQVEIMGQYGGLMLFLQHLLVRPELLLIERAELVKNQEQLLLKMQLSHYQLSGSAP